MGSKHPYPDLPFINTHYSSTRLPAFFVYIGHKRFDRRDFRPRGTASRGPAIAAAATTTTTTIITTTTTPALRSIAKAGTVVVLHEAEEGFAVVSKAAGTGWCTLLEALRVLFQKCEDGAKDGDGARLCANDCAASSFPPTPLFTLEKVSRHALVNL